MKSSNALYIIILFLVIVTGCLKDPDMPDGIKYAKEPEVETYEPTSVYATSFEASGKVVKENGAEVIARGFLLGNTNPVTYENKLQQSENEEEEDGSFKHTFTKLTNDQQYYVAAYATNVAGRSIGETFSVSTLSGLGEIMTLKAVSIKAESAIVGGKILTHGEGNITRKGIYYSKQSFNIPNQSTDSALVTIPEDSFTYVLTGIDRQATYYYRAFVTTDLGTRIGNQQSFTTTHGRPKLTSFQQMSLGFDNAGFSAVVEEQGDTQVTKKGFCYATVNLPTIENDTIHAGSGLGYFSGTITGLQPHTQYYVRAFAENSYGVEYSGETVRIITLDELPTVNTINAVLNNNATISITGEVLDEGITPVSASGFCWAVNAEPNIEAHTTVILSSGKTAFTGTVSDLRGNTTYNVRVFATNESGTTYGDLYTFTTPAIFTDAAVFSGAPRTPGSAAYFTIAGNAYLYGGDLGTKPANELWMFNPNSGFTPWRPAPDALSWSTAVSYDNQSAFVLGGYDSENKLSNAFYHYMTTNTWAEIESSSASPSAVARTVACQTNMQVYFIGGIRDNTNNLQYISKEVWVFNPFQKNWTQKTDFPDAQYGGITAYHDNIMYAGLGINNLTYPFTYNRNLYRYNSGNDSWSLTTSLPDGNAMAGTQLDNCLYVVNTAGYIWCYDIDANSWTQKSRLGTDSQAIHCIYTLNNKIYIGLGSNSGKLICYDPAWDN